VLSWYNNTTMKVLKPSEIVKETPFMLYKKILLESGYNLSRVKTSYRNKIKKLFEEFSDAEDRIKYMITFYSEIREEFPYHAITKLPIPHPDLFFQNDIWEFTKKLIPDDKKKVSISYVNELVFDFLNLLKKEDVKSIVKLIKVKEKEYGRKKVVGSLIKAFNESGKSKEILKRILSYLSSNKRR